MTRVDWWSLSDEELNQQCAYDRFRASGPGGQKRNKTDSAVRLRHEPTGVLVVAVESRSQHENRARALRRLREALALQHRQPPPEDLRAGLPACVRKEEPDGSAKLLVAAKRPEYLPTVALLLDALDAAGGRLGEVAERLGVSTANLTSVLGTTPEVWRATQELRAKHGLKALR